MQVELYNKDGQKSGTIELSEEVFAIEPNDDAMHRSVVVYLAHQRQGTHKTKTRAEVSGGGKKPWKQKGRGTARSGSSRSPLWAKGGTIHGPQPHKYEPDLPKKIKKLAKKSALSLRMAEENLLVVEDFSMSEIKTKEFFQILKNLKLDDQKTLIMLSGSDSNLFVSSRNIPNVTVHPYDKVSTYDILNHKKLILFKGAVEKLHEALNN